MDKKKVDSLISEASYCFDKGEFEKSAKLLFEVLAHDSGNVDARTGMEAVVSNSLLPKAKAAYEAGRVQESVEIYKEIKRYIPWKSKEISRNLRSIREVLFCRVKVGRSDDYKILELRYNTLSIFNKDNEKEVAYKVDNMTDISYSASVACLSFMYHDDDREYPMEVGFENVPNEEIYEALIDAQHGFYQKGTIYESSTEKIKSSIKGYFRKVFKQVSAGFLCVILLFMFFGRSDKKPDADPPSPPPVVEYVVEDDMVKNSKRLPFLKENSEWLHVSGRLFKGVVLYAGELDSPKKRRIGPIVDFRTDMLDYRREIKNVHVAARRDDGSIEWHNVTHMARFLDHFIRRDDKVYSELLAKAKEKQKQKGEVGKWLPTTSRIYDGVIIYCLKEDTKDKLEVYGVVTDAEFSKNEVELYMPFTRHSGNKAFKFVSRETLNDDKKFFVNADDDAYILGYYK